MNDDSELSFDDYVIELISEGWDVNGAITEAENIESEVNIYDI